MRKIFPDLKFCRNTLQWQLIFFLFISQAALYSQVRIKEKLEINPKPKESVQLNNSASASHKIRFEAHWDAENVGAVISGRMVIRNIFDQTDVKASSGWVSASHAGDMTVSFDNATCNYEVVYEFKGFTGEYEFLQVKLNVYWNDILASTCQDRVQSFWDYGYSFGYPGYFGYYTTWYPFFYAGFEPFLSYGNCFEMSVGIRGSLDGPIFHMQTDILTVTILKGDDLFQFLDLSTGEYYEKSISTTPEFMTYNLVPKGKLPARDSIEIVLQYQINNDIKTIYRTIYDTYSTYVDLYCFGEHEVSHNNQKEIECYLDNECGDLPTGVTLRAEITKGSEYGVLIDPVSGNTGNILTGLDPSEGISNIIFYANGKKTATEDTVRIEVTASKDDIEPSYIDLIVTRDPIKISLIPSEISPGDTASIMLQEWDYLSGSYVDMSEGETFEIGIQEGCGLGEILLPDSSKTNYYRGDYSPNFKLRFIAADSLSSDSASVFFRVGRDEGVPCIASPSLSPLEKSLVKQTIAGSKKSNNIMNIDTASRKAEIYEAISQKLNNNKRLKNLSEAAKKTMLTRITEKIARASSLAKTLVVGGDDNGKTCSGVNYLYPERGSSSELIVQPLTILLGETKYFQTKLNDKDQLIIEEVKAELGTAPQCTGLKEDVWKDNPVSPAIQGNTCGIYWEKKYPLYTFSCISTYSNYNQNIISMGDLEKGIIRIIGRFWEKGKEENYKAILTAKYTDKNTGSIKITQKEIKVIKPSSPIGKKYSKAKDVFDKPFNYDDLILELSGKYGILPQFVKGQMSVECAIKDFGGDIGWGFAPSYRYEPFTSQFLANLKSESGKFYITPTTTDFNNVPQNHQHLNISYYRQRKTVWEVINEHSQLVDFNSKSTYGYKENANHKMHWVKRYSQITNLQTNFNTNSIQEFKVNQKGITAKEKLKREIIAYDSANARMSRFLQYEWRGVENKKAGLKYSSENGARNMIAQTRTASSYGPFQYLYTTAILNINYSREKVPEELNQKEYLDDFVKAMRKNYLIKFMNKTTECNNNWPQGYERSINLYLHARWNSDKNYPLDILNASKNFIPSK